MSSRPAQVRSLYRRILRELPMRKPSALANPSAVQNRIRAAFTTTSAPQSEAQTASLLQQAEQITAYLQSQRNFMTLVERYNPGMNMTEEDRVRLTARRVGMDLPEELRAAFNKGGRGGSGDGRGSGPA